MAFERGENVGPYRIVEQLAATMAWGRNFEVYLGEAAVQRAGKDQPPGKSVLQILRAGARSDVHHRRST